MKTNRFTALLLAATVTVTTVMADAVPVFASEQAAPLTMEAAVEDIFLKKEVAVEARDGVPAAAEAFAEAKKMEGIAKGVLDGAIAEDAEAASVVEAKQAAYDAVVDPSYAAKVQAAEEEVAAAQAVVDEKQAAVNAAQAMVDNSAAQAALGSWGFFQEVEADNPTALKEIENALFNSTYNSYTRLGAATDATSLENMKNTFQWIRACNALRADNAFESVPALKVNSVMMAYAQADANYSDQNIAHAQQFNVGENLAWNWGSNPFKQWYDEELVNYQTNNGKQTGHMFNIVDSSYTTTGFAINTLGSRYGQTFCQVFYFYGGSYNTMTVDEYEEMFLEYYDRVVGNPKAALNAANAELKTAKKALATADTNLANAKKAESTYNKKLEAAQKALDDAKQVKTEAEVNVSEKQTVYEEAAAAMKEAEATLEAAQDLVNTAMQDLEESISVFSDLQRAAGVPEEQIGHLWGSVEYDQLQHWCYCSICDAKEAVGIHVNEAGNGVCDVCGTLVTPEGGLWTEGLEAGFVYTGKAIKPSVKVYVGSRLLTEGVDYTLSYSNNINVCDKDEAEMINAALAANGVKPGKFLKIPSVTVKAKGNYTGSVTQNFTILPQNISKTSVEDVFAAESGKAIKVNPIVMVADSTQKNGYRTLKAGKDYVIEMPVGEESGVVAEGNTEETKYEPITTLTDAGDYDLRIVGIGNYIGETTFAMHITKDVLTSKVTIGKIKDQPYSGNPITPEPVLTYNKTAVSTDLFDVTWSNNKAIGTATVTITAKEGSGFAGSKSAAFKIVGTSLAKAVLAEPIAPKAYDGMPYEPFFQVMLGGKRLYRHLDYEVSYLKNDRVGTAQAVITGIGAYTGSKTFTFKITPSDALEKLVIDPISETYVKGGVKVKPVIHYGEKLLAEKTDYTLSYANTANAALQTAEKAPSVTIAFKGSYSGKVTVKYDILQKNLNECTWTMADKVYSEKPGAWKQTVAVITDVNGKKLSAGSDYDKAFAYFKDEEMTVPFTDTDVDPNADQTVYVGIEGAGSYTGVLAAKYRICKQAITGAKITVPAQVYTGSEIKLTEADITATFGKNPPLVMGKDYEIVEDSYVKNVNKGTASVTIRGIGNYGGTKVVKFKITAQSLKWWYDLLGI